MPHPGPLHPLGRRVLPDAVLPPEAALDLARSPRLEKLYELLAALPQQPLTPPWNSVVLFFNLSGPLPTGYANTDMPAVLRWLDQGADPCNPSISEFLYDYWKTLSYGHLAFGLEVPRDDSGAPLIPTVQAPGGNAQDWGSLIAACIDANPDAVWRAAGSLSRDGQRWIPSAVLVQNYPARPEAWSSEVACTIGGIDYIVGDRIHLPYWNLEKWSPPEAPQKIGRGFWGVLCHEYGHNFLEFADLYSPAGCTGYWDLNGDSAVPGRMSEVCSAIKARAGWLSFTQVISGPAYGEGDFALQPYTTSGEALKVIPDPQYTPHEYFLLEYRESTGDEVWRPDGGLPEGGLLVIHINERLGVSGCWLMHDAPYFDPEFANFSDHGGALWTGHHKLKGVLFRPGTNTSFGPTTLPASHFYGGRPSGLSVSQIRLEGGLCKFRLAIDGHPRVGWTIGERDRCLAGRFTAASRADGAEVFCRNDEAAALLVHREAQWLVAWSRRPRIGEWLLGAQDRELAADLDGDGRDEVYLRAPGRAGVLRWRVNGFDCIAHHAGSIGAWPLADAGLELAADLKGDGRDEILAIRRRRVAVLELGPSGLRVLSNQPVPEQVKPPRPLPVVSGRFRHRDREEILVGGGERLVLLGWSPRQRQLRAEVVPMPSPPGLPTPIGAAFVVGDFDGDGLGEVYARRGGQALLLKWRGRGFHVLWSAAGSVSSAGMPAVPLRASDVSYAGRFMPDRDCVLHRAGDFLAILAWTGAEFVVRHHKTSPFAGRWPLAPADRFVIGDYHRKGPDLGDPDSNTVVDGIADVFIHNAAGTATMGVNDEGWSPANPNLVIREMGLTWIAGQHLLWDR